MKVFVALSALLAVAVAAPGLNSIETSDDSSTSLRKMISHCFSSEDVITCLSVKGITSLNRVARSPNIDVLPGVSFVRYALKHCVKIEHNDELVGS